MLRGGAEHRLLQPGDRLGRYRLVRLVADGGMGRIWRAEDGTRVVALKTIRPDLVASGDYKFRAMLLDEARLVARLDHPHIASVLDADEHDGVLYVAFEWVEGSPLEVLARAAHAMGEAHLPFFLRVHADVARALHAAHELKDDRGELLGVIHRDVTPRNVLVSERGEAKLIDFGIAKARDRWVGDTTTGFVKGTFAYASPEQARARPIDRRADVWSLGAVLHCCVVGRPPYAHRAQYAEYMLPGHPEIAVDDAIPEAVRAVLVRALRRDPSERYETAAAFAAGIDEALRSLGGAPPMDRACARLRAAALEEAEEAEEAIDTEAARPTERDAPAPRAREVPWLARHGTTIAVTAAVVLTAIAGVAYVASIAR